MGRGITLLASKLPSEEDLNSRLRELTEQTRHAREELEATFKRRANVDRTRALAEDRPRYRVTRSKKR